MANLQKHDSNGDGQVTLEERAAQMRAKEEAGWAKQFRQQTDQFRQQFGQAVIDRFDQDKTGILERDELYDLRRAISKAAAQCRPEAMQPFETNKNGQIDPEEQGALFAHYIKEQLLQNSLETNENLYVALLVTLSALAPMPISATVLGPILYHYQDRETHLDEISPEYGYHLTDWRRTVGKMARCSNRFSIGWTIAGSTVMGAQACGRKASSSSTGAEHVT